jgi:hypothetical protein
MKNIEYRLELSDISGEHRPIAVFRAASPFLPVSIGERFDDEGWPRLQSNDAPGTPEAPRCYTVHSIKHVVTQGKDKIIARYCLNLKPFDGDRSPVWGQDPPSPQASNVRT